MKKKIRIGFDFDGVVAYNPFRICRYPISLIKKYLFGVQRLSFWYPHKKWQQIFWIIIHESSVFPSKGVDLVQNMVKDKIIEAHLITGRYSFLDHKLNTWLKRYCLDKVFKTININKNNEQPHLFKEKMIKKLKLDYFIEDNLDIVNYLENSSYAKILWIYNITDYFYKRESRYPYLKKALEDIISKDKLKIKK